MNRQATRSPLWGPAATFLWGSLIAAIYVLVSGSVSMLLVLDQTVDPARAGTVMDGTDVALVVLAGAAALLLATLMVARLRTRMPRSRYLALRALPIRTSLYWLGLTLLLLLASDLLTLALERPLVPEFVRRIQATTDARLLLWLAIVIAAPLSEEVFFRGFLLPGLARAPGGPVAAVVVTALVWAGIHLQYDLYYMSQVFVLGLVLGTARLHTGTLLLPILLHALVNAVALVEASLIAL